MATKKMSDLHEDKYPPVLPVEKLILIAFLVISLLALVSGVIVWLNPG